ncbi:amidase [Spirosoma utsteinense]|uniref:Asp-tRNA(Asn)/Glu-tRNA(Gln) amidotransferase A subunit family amidase n=1 Tax=Spirosoma utsteinense TaxID=2585773 RepID=A0ABR6WF79_9BACT|nr:amidase family protein [Spirosoma utsteinense]MBC3785674.1 Asp-tRNA(Asn)/Glu-tRNA(Gln) amidotransferase A subunit family amidase [Spirosoma utsteinense]MBC3794592.1 Asp-tRNA(Asn)/Glu-tRNA(Gln) amidotransferase A subunit family amidase [Spirosoma utsteinense]
MVKFSYLSRWLRVFLFVGVLSPVWQGPAAAQPSVKASSAPAFEPVETTISAVHRAFRNGSLTSEQLVNAYLERIRAYDQPTKLNSIILVNPDAIATARALDAEFKKTGKLRPLHGIPVIVKDNFNTKGLQTTGGSVALKGFIPSEDAWQVRKLREAGAIVLAKSNMAEWAFTPMHSQSSMAGETLNPYNLAYVPAGSSGGTAAAVAANLGTVGLGSDTGNSIRGPSSHNALAGFRTSLGLVSRYGIIPLYTRNDVGGPMCRTVDDAVRLLEVTAGYDPNDPITKYSQGKIPKTYTQFLRKDGLKGARIGVLRQLSDKNIHPEIKQLFDRAITDMTRAGAQVVDVTIPDFDSLRANQWCADFRVDLETYLKTFVRRDTLKTLEDVIRVGGYSDLVRDRLTYQQTHTGRASHPEIACGDAFTDPLRIAYRNAIEAEMNRLHVDALIYPTWNYPPALVGDAKGYKGDNSQLIAPSTGQPAFTIPMGYTTGDLPAGLQFLGRLFDEPTLIRLAYGYEQQTHHRVAPKKFVALGR